MVTAQLFLETTQQLKKSPIVIGEVFSKKLSDNLKVSKVRSSSLSRESLDKLSKEELIEIIYKQEGAKDQLKLFLQKQLGSLDDDRKKSRKPRDISKFPKRRILLKFLYLGWNFDGYACQQNTSNTIEHHLFEALKKCALIEDRQTSKYHVCGRTDKGVSAFEQVVSIDVRSRIQPADQLTRIDNEMTYCSLLNRALPKQIRVISWMPLKDDWYSARFHCTERSYQYFFPRGDLNIEKMQESCRYLQGVHDFRNFCRMDIRNGVVNFKRTIEAAEIRIIEVNHEGQTPFDTFCLEIKGISFLRQMIRAIFSVLLRVGKEKESPCVVKELFDIENVKTRPDYAFAAEIPLNLFKTKFREEEIDEQTAGILNNWVYEEESLGEVIRCLQEFWCLEKMKSTMLYEMIKVLQQNYSQTFKEKSEIFGQALGLSFEIKRPHPKKLLDRQRGLLSLEERVEHFKKKGRITVSEIKSKSKF